VGDPQCIGLAGLVALWPTSRRARLVSQGRWPAGLMLGVQPRRQRAGLVADVAQAGARNGLTAANSASGPVTTASFAFEGTPVPRVT